MSRVTRIEKARSAKTNKITITHGRDGFTPCNQDMTICGNCEGNRSKNKCPRLKEWLAKQRS